MDKDLIKDLNFCLELEQMKNIFRQTKIIGQDRRENDAEHTFHIATMAIILEKYNSSKIDIGKTVQMLLVHDLVEMYAGDTFAFNIEANICKLNREKEAMVKIKNLTSKDTGDKIESLWHEFEEKTTSESKFANAMDRIQPLIANLERNDGGTWTEHKVKLAQVYERLEPVKDFNIQIYDYLIRRVNLAKENGLIY